MDNLLLEASNEEQWLGHRNSIQNRRQLFILLRTWVGRSVALGGYCWKLSIDTRSNSAEQAMPVPWKLANVGQRTRTYYAIRFSVCRWCHHMSDVVVEHSIEFDSKTNSMLRRHFDLKCSPKQMLINYLSSFTLTSDGWHITGHWRVLFIRTLSLIFFLGETICQNRATHFCDIVGWSLGPVEWEINDFVVIGCPIVWERKAVNRATRDAQKRIQ